MSTRMARLACHNSCVGIDGDNWVERDLRHVWHPCTQMKDHESVPMIPLRSGSGVWLEDFAGKRYVDGISSWWVNLFGHSNPRINAAVREQLERLEHAIFAGFTHPPAVTLAEELARIAPPGLVRCCMPSPLWHTPAALGKRAADMKPD